MKSGALKIMGYDIQMEIQNEMLPVIESVHRIVKHLET